jgi:hypothetical protein
MTDTGIVVVGETGKMRQMLIVALDGLNADTSVAEKVELTA